MTKEMQAFINDNIEQIENIREYLIQLHGLTTTLKFSFKEDDSRMPLSFMGVADYLADVTEGALDIITDFKFELEGEPECWELLSDLKVYTKNIFKEALDKIIIVEQVSESLFFSISSIQRPREWRQRRKP